MKHLNPNQHPPTEPLPRQDDRVGPPRYVMLSTAEGWQLLLEHAGRYVRWSILGEVGQGGPAIPGIDVAASSLERDNGGLRGKPALEREGNEIGHFQNLRSRDGSTVAMSRCLDEGELKLQFDGPVMNGCWRLARTGSSRRQPETWVLARD